MFQYTIHLDVRRTAIHTDSNDFLIRHPGFQLDHSENMDYHCYLQPSQNYRLYPCDKDKLNDPDRDITVQSYH